MSAVPPACHVFCSEYVLIFLVATKGIIMSSISHQAPVPQLASLPRSRMPVTYDDLHQRLIIRGRIPPLGHLEYLLARSLLVQHQEWVAGRCSTRTMSPIALRQATGARSLVALYRLVSEVRNKLSPFDLQIKVVLGDGYFMDNVPA